jgi:hypothetical protein
MWISIGTLFGILIVTHILVAGISNWKSERYFKKEREGALLPTTADNTGKAE